LPIGQVVGCDCIREVDPRLPVLSAMNEMRHESGLSPMN